MCWWWHWGGSSATALGVVLMLRSVGKALLLGVLLGFCIAAEVVIAVALWGVLFG